MRGVATFLVTAVLGVVHFFYKPPAPVVLQNGTAPIPATSTFPETSSAGSASVATATKNEAGPSVISNNIPVNIQPAQAPTSSKVGLLPPAAPTGVQLRTPTSSMAETLPSTIPTGIPSSSPTISSPIQPISYPASSTNPLDVIGSFLFPNTTTLVPTSTSVSAPTAVIPPPPMPASTGSAQPAQTSSVSTVSTSTVLDSQIAALSGLPLSTPQKQEPLNTTGPEMYKVFDFAVSANSFTPNAIIVLQGDLAQLNVTSSINTTLESKDLQFSVPVTTGGTSAVSIPATDVGTFVFYATGSNSQPIFGYFVVRSRT